MRRLAVFAVQNANEVRQFGRVLGLLAEIDDVHADLLFLQTLRLLLQILLVQLQR